MCTTHKPAPGASPGGEGRECGGHSGVWAGLSAASLRSRHLLLGGAAGVLLGEEDIRAPEWLRAGAPWRQGKGADVRGHRGEPC